jgi:hypothetical protein
MYQQMIHLCGMCAALWQCLPLAASSAAKSNPSSVLTADDVREMRQLRTEGMTTGQLAIRYGISAKQVWRICKL